MIPVTDYYTRHCDAPVGPGLMAFDVLSVPTDTPIDANSAVQRWQESKPNARNGSGVSVPFIDLARLGVRGGHKH
jgi:hypothetical protein